MADADNKETSQAPDLSKVTESISSLGEAVKAMAEQQRQLQEGMLTLAQANKKQAEPVDDNIYDPKVLIQRTNETISKTVASALQEERNRNYTMASLAQEYPEINSGDAKIREAILTAQKKLPLEMQGSAVGYEMAIKAAMSEQGIVPVSRRQKNDDDYTVPTGRNTERGGKKSAKLANETLEVAALMGLDPADPKVVERLQKHSTRNFGKYR